MQIGFKTQQEITTVIERWCDYQHLWDEHYSIDDHGVEILRDDGEAIAKEFIAKFCEGEK